MPDASTGELERIGQELITIEVELAERLSRLRAGQAKVVRDGIGAAAGLVLAVPTAGISVLLVFWTMTSLLVDCLDVWRERQAIRALDMQIAALARRQAALTAASAVTPAAGAP